MGAAPDKQWTGEKVHLLMKLFDEGLRTTIIAQQLGCSRDAVNNKLQRLGLRVKRDLEASGIGAALAAKARRSAPDAPYFPPPRPVPAGFRALSLDDLPEDGCRYIQGDGPPFLYCGLPRKEGSSFCWECHRVVYVPPAPPSNVRPFRRAA